jgi:hypothetical protein
MRNEKLELIALSDVRIRDPFWNRYTGLVTKEIIPYQWRALNDEIPEAEPSHCMKNFRVAAGLEQGDFEGFVFQDTDLAKWLEAVAYSLAYEKNPELEKLADDAIELVEKAQEPNGYLNTYFSIKAPGKQFKNLKEGHELYTAGHFIEAAVAYYKVTGKDKLLNIMRRMADLICEVFHTSRYDNAVPGHEEIELALVKLADVTGEEKYREMAYDFINRRGNGSNYLSEESAREDYIDVWHDRNPYRPEYGQCHLPVRQQKTAEGHAVRATYLYCAMADLAYAYQDEALFRACENLYHNIVQKRMYITGGIGSSGVLERFTTDYDLPNDTAYAESCASIGLALFCRRMAQITGDAAYVDTMEQALMNNVLAGVAMDGKSFFYVNPLEVWPQNCIPATDKDHVKPVRQKWFGCACCPPNIARTLASLGEYTCFTGKNGLWLNLFVGGTIHTKMGDCPVRLEIKSEFPYEGRVCIKVETENGVACDAKDAPESEKESASSSVRSVEGDIYIRIPSYAGNPRFVIDGKPVAPEVTKGYARLCGPWSSQEIRYEFDMEPHFVYANPKVRADAGKAAVKMGPLVYCLEEADNGANFAALYVDVKHPLRKSFEKSLLGGVPVLQGWGKRIRTEGVAETLYQMTPPELETVELTYVPYFAWGNRTPGEMSVWNKLC